MKDEVKSEVDYALLEDPRMSEQALQTIMQTKQGLDDFVDTLQLLSDPKARKNLEKGLKEALQGQAVKLTVKEIRK
jgi:predicted DNA-binding protein YlxM (UPF0122 family)